MSECNGDYGGCIGSKEIKQEELETMLEPKKEFNLKRALDEMTGQNDYYDEQLKRCEFLPGCKIKTENVNGEDLSETCNGDGILPMEPSTSHSVTVSCEPTDGTILTDFGEKTTKLSKSTSLRHVMVFKGVEMEYFIELVKQNEVLWDGSSEEYHTRSNKKKQAWENIAAEMSNDLKQVDDEICRKIWLQLRRSYANEKRLQKLCPGSRATRNCKYRRYFDAMKFLDGIMEEEYSRLANAINGRESKLINLDTVNDSFFISEPEGGKSCSNSPAPDPGTSKKDITENIRKCGDVRKEVAVESDISTSKMIDTLALLAQQLQSQGGNESAETVQQQLMQQSQPKSDNSTAAAALTEQQFYQQLQTCFFMLTPEKQVTLQHDIMKYAFRRTNQLMDDTNP